MPRPLLRLAAALAILAAASGLAAAWANSGNPRHDALVELSLPAQREALRRLLHDAAAEARTSCPGIHASYLAGLDPGRTAFWDVHCRGTGNWRLAIPPDDGAVVATACPRQVGSCFIPISQSGLDTRLVAEARCNAACELQSGALRQACMARCLQGTDSIAAAGAPGRERHVVIYVVEQADLPEAVLIGGEDLAAARLQARRSCEAVPGATACREAIAVANRCAALVRSPGGSLFVGAALELDDAEATARQACPEGRLCEVVISGC
jgi:hypothetical protein